MIVFFFRRKRRNGWIIVLVMIILLIVIDDGLGSLVKASIRNFLTFEIRIRVMGRSVRTQRWGFFELFCS